MPPSIWSVPYYMGERLIGLEVPEPHVVIEPELPDGTQQERMGVLNRAVADAVASDDTLPVVYAGDCVVILGVTAGLQQRGVDPVVVFYDAHGDFNTWDTTPSGFIGGMPLAMMTGRGELTIAEAAGMQILDDEEAILVGARDLDPLEEDLLRASAVHMVDVEHVASAIPHDRDLYVHVDVDVVDPRDVPAVNYPAPEGPSVEAVAESVGRLAETGRVVAFSVSTWNPALPGAAQAAKSTRLVAAPFLRGDHTRTR